MTFYPYPRNFLRRCEAETPLYARARGEHEVTRLARAGEGG